MTTILLYIFIILVGFLVAKKRLIPDFLKTKVSHFQTAALFFLLCVMGYKIGSDEKIIANFSQLGFQAIIITIFTISFSIIFVFLFYKGGKK